MVTGAENGSAWAAVPPLIRALEVGHWQRAVNLPASIHFASLDPPLPHLVAAIRTTAGGLHSQACGDSAAACRQYDAAAAQLPPGLRWSTTDGQNLARLVPDTMTGINPTIGPLLWRTACVIWREQSLIADMRRRLTRFTTARDHLVEAYIQFMFDVEFSPFTWTRQPKGMEPRPRVAPTRAILSSWASSLRKLADPRAGDISESVWKDIGAHGGLKAEALAWLAERPLTPWTSATDARGSIPVRLGHLRAWEYAKGWRNDLGYE